MDPERINELLGKSRRLPRKAFLTENIPSKSGAAKKNSNLLNDASVDDPLLVEHFERGWKIGEEVQDMGRHVLVGQQNEREKH
jgi:hypothetical protein